MAVYFAPRNSNRITINDILGMVGGRFLDSMMARDEAARQYRYGERLAASNAERTAAEAQRGRDFEMEKIDKGYARQDDLIGRHDAYVRENPYAIPGTGGMMGTFLALGGKGDAAQYQPYLLPRQEQISTGDKLISRTMYPDGTSGGESSWDVGMSPKEAGDLAIKRAALAQEAAARKEAANRPQPMQTIPDGRGGYVWVDSRNMKTYPVPGVTAPGADPNAWNREMIKLMIENWQKGDSGGRGIQSNSSNRSGNASYIDTLLEKAAETAIREMYPQDSTRDPKVQTVFPEYVPVYENVGKGGLNAYSSALGGVGGPASAGGAARSPQTAGGGGKRISMADINKEARIQNRLPEDLIREAQESGFTVY